MIYWGARQKIVSLGRLETGDAVETVSHRKGFTYALLHETGSDEEDSRFIPPMRGHYYDIVPFWSDVPVMIKTYTACLPAGMPLQSEFYNGECAPFVHFMGDSTLYRWEKKDIPVFKAEPNAVDASDTQPKLLVSTSPDWKAKSLWFHKVNEDFGSFDVTPEVKKKTDELTASCKTEAEKVSVLTHWVAEEIRYSGLTMGPGEGYTLHKGGMTFRDRCGVCKDKAGMLITMLRAAGFESYPAMTMAGSRIDRIPADQFNHCVVIWRRGPGDLVLLDPTWVPGVRELWSSAEQQQEYLMGLPEGADLSTTPVSPPGNHFFRVKGKSELAADGTLTGTVTVEAEGQSDARMRRSLLRGMRNQWQPYFERAVWDLSPKAVLRAIEAVDPYDIEKPMRIAFHYVIPDYAVRAKERLVFIPAVARHLFYDRGSNAHLFMKLDDTAERTTPFVTSCSKLVEFSEEITLPKGYKVAYRPAFKSVSGPAADFSAQYAESGGKLKFQEKLSMKKRIYPAGEWSNFRDAVQSVKSVAETPVVLTGK
jgi:hypothetical protein